MKSYLPKLTEEEFKEEFRYIAKDRGIYDTRRYKGSGPVNWSGTRWGARHLAWKNNMKEEMRYPNKALLFGLGISAILLFPIYVPFLLLRLFITNVIKLFIWDSMVELGSWIYWKISSRTMNVQ